MGSSFVINEQIYRGSLYGSGQIGHTIVNPDGVVCDCGRYG
ncbi:ROK family protein [Pseudomonas aeruginosa]